MNHIISMVSTVQCEPAGRVVFRLSNTAVSGGREMQLIQSGQLSILCYSQMYC